MIFDHLVKIYQEIGWEIERAQGDTILSTTYGGKNANWVFVANTDEENEILVMFARLPFPCPPEKYSEVSVFMEKANFGMSHGAWVIDRSDGEVRFRVGVDLGGIELTIRYVRQLTLHTNLTMEYYLPGWKALLEEGKSAEEALNIVLNR